MKGVLDANADIANLCQGQWVRLVVLHPDTGELHRFDGNEFSVFHGEAKELPVVEDSRQCYSGHRGNVGFAIVKASQLEGQVQGSKRKSRALPAGGAV